MLTSQVSGVLIQLRLCYCQSLKSRSSVLILLDLSAAFDNVNHQILLPPLSSLGITGIPHCWFKSYLTGRSFRVAWRGEVSKAYQLVTVVPQGTVLGPLLFSTYTTSLGPIIQCPPVFPLQPISHLWMPAQATPSNPWLSDVLSLCSADLSVLNMYKSLLSSFSAQVHTAKSSYFHNKINNASDTRTKTAKTPLFSFCPLSEAEVSKFLSSHPTTCPLDPIPSHLIQSISPTLLPALTHIINTSLLTGTFPTAFKQARVTPLLKKPTLNTSLIDPPVPPLIAGHYRDSTLLNPISVVGLSGWPGEGRYPKHIDWSVLGPLLFSTYTTSLGPIIQLTFKDHIAKTARSCSIIRKIRPFLTEQAAQLLVQALNAAERLVFNKPKRAHVTPLFISLHWLPVATRIKFKTLMLAYRTATGSLPPEV
ncbi:hypothetical protein H4Q32_029354 [Labeo rohita]|uniref:Reverse transcriptase domain-containing protein n=1 Tax=Labeo rohita TaxID=84645 RepID=A0ABQ8MXY6_LABRO|nr:hypothetical protein H4Q32_029354 [Labeo rohita]